MCALNNPPVANIDTFRDQIRDYMPVQVVGWANGASVVSGTGAVSVKQDTAVRLDLGSTHASTAGVYTVIAASPGQAAAESVNFNKKLYVAFLFTPRNATFTSVTHRLYITQSTTIVDLAAHGLGIYVLAGAVSLATYGAGGAQVLVDAATTLVNATPYWLVIEHDPAVADRLYINGVLVATQSTAASIPSTVPSATYRPFISVARSGGSDVTESVWDFNGFFFGTKL